MLEVKDLHAFYGRAHVLHGISLEVRAGEVVALLGRNGAGKSTAMKAIMGLVPPARGEVSFAVASASSACHPIALRASALAMCRRSGDLHRTVGDGESRSRPAGGPGPAS